MMRRFLFLAFLLCVLSGSKPALAAPRTLATITATSGKAWMRHGGAPDFLTLSRRASLQARDVVGTGNNGKAAILFGDGSQIRLNANAAVEIQTPQSKGNQNLFRALSGVVWARLRPDKGAQTQYSNLAVRGTEFQLEVSSNGTTTLSVIEGAVNFWNDKGEVLVPAGQQSIIKPGIAPTAPVAATNANLLVEWTFDLNRTTIRREKVRETPESSASPKVNLAWEALEKDSPAAAEKFAQQAIALDANSSEAHITLGIALLRQSKFDEAQRAFEEDLKSGSKAYHYQACAWLALLFLSQNQKDKALQYTKAAVLEAPESVLARSHYALALFFNGDFQKAEREARQLLKLDNESVEARITLAQVLLAQGDNEEAARLAAQAVALDDGNAFAHYTLAVADSARRDYSHAERSLQTSLKLASDFAPAAALLARVRIREGHEKEALTELREVANRQSNSSEAQAALGEELYERANYDEAIAQLKKATALNPNGALNFATLSRVLLDANKLGEAIVAAQEAVRRAPSVGQFHALLGRAYEFNNLTSQAEREYRLALSLDPQNALALAMLSLRHTGIDLRIGGAGFAQSFLVDPAISEQILRGGVDTESTIFGGTDSRLGGQLTHRDVFANGKVHDFLRLRHDQDNGDRNQFANDISDAGKNNDGSRASDGVLGVTFTPQPGTNLFGYVFAKKLERGLPGPIADNGLVPPGSAHDRRQVQDIEGALALKRRVGARGSLWLSLRADRLHDRFDLDSPSASPQTRTGTSPSHTADARFDYTLERDARRQSTLTLGVASSSGDFDLDVRDLGPGPGGTFLGRTLTLNDARSFLAYGQISRRLSDRLFVIAQYRHLREQISRLAGAGTPTLVFDQTRDFDLPSLVLTYQMNKKTALRFSASKRASELNTSTLAPVETLLATEESTLPRGVADETSLVQLDLERYVGKRGFLKVFGFTSRAREVNYAGAGFTGSFADPVNSLPGSLPTSFAPNLIARRVRVSGLGARYEQTLSHRLFANFSYVLRDSSNRTRGATYNGDNSPYEPRSLGVLGLDYIGGRGTKLNFRLRHQGGFASTLNTKGTVHEFPSKTYFDFRLAREPSVHHEYFLEVRNLFNARQIEFENFPVGGRRFTVGYTNRF
jgi:tetratricopeptide (TPR) repeat protein